MQLLIFSDKLEGFPACALTLSWIDDARVGVFCSSRMVLVDIMFSLRCSMTGFYYLC